MFRGFFDFFSSNSNDDKVSITSQDASPSASPSMGRLTSLTTDSRTATLEVALNKANPTSEEIKELARHAIKDEQPEAFATIASKYPETLTPEVVAKAIHEERPSNQFVASLVDQKDSGTSPASITQLSIFDENEKEQINKFQEEHRGTQSPYIVYTGESHEFSEFNMAGDAQPQLKKR